MSLFAALRDIRTELRATPEPAEDATASEHLRYIGLVLFSSMLTWTFLALVLLVEVVAIAASVIW